MFRYERPQAGRQRQFHQIGVEWLGAERARSDVEVIALAWDLLASFGVGGLALELNSLGTCLLYTSPSPRDQRGSRMPSSA